MYPINLISIPVAALIPLAVGMVWFNPKVFGKIWIESSNINTVNLPKQNVLLIFALTYFLNLFVAMVVGILSVHQTGVFGIFAGEIDFMNPNAQSTKDYLAFMQLYADKFRTFGHGALHGTISGLFLAIPLISTHALYEGRGLRYILVNGLYWVVSMCLMGGIICVWK
jgi:hypothetical protein